MSLDSFVCSKYFDGPEIVKKKLKHHPNRDGYDMGDNNNNFSIRNQTNSNGRVCFVIVSIISVMIYDYK